MGAWGYKVFNNDTSCDLMYEWTEPIHKILKKKLSHQYDYDQVRAAAEFIIRMSPCYTFDLEMVNPLIEKLQYIVSDQNWIGSWNKKASIKRDINRQINELTIISKKTQKKFK